MGLEAVVGDIKEKGRKGAAQIQAETDAEVRRILSEAQERAASIKQQAEEEVERDVQRIITQEVSAANLSVKREVLNAEKDTLSRVHEATIARIGDLPADFHAQALRALLPLAAEALGGGVVYCNARDIPTVKEVLAESKDLSGFSVGEPVSIEGGIVVESADGRMKIDYTYRTFLETVWESGLKDASDILFP
ncbi:MAG: V-type ATP synthase subunit E family protein [Methanofollis sp.]|jgi:V/A-type H+-transporting ATPase subunit E|uniref:V-type ATP synthase subunit E family protein n=1 Tax=Methanofollis TaxID=81416 RepID=UPI000834FBE8|nr:MULTISPECIES: V-type ATP synthase subunit E family protein [Methanofollis]MDD4254902.1 V-type ATP synthase subunit E family protein [Methanofollis sp.]